MNISPSAVLALLLVPWLGSCSKYDQRLTASNVQAPQVIILRKADGQGPISSMSLKAAGRLDGKATFTLILNEEPYKVAQVSDSVSFEWDGDWYADSAVIRYEPVDVKTGYIVFSYSFLGP